MEYANRLGMSAKTLLTDTRIAEEFDISHPTVILARENELPREYFVTALGAPDPVAALAAAIALQNQRSLDRRGFREHVRSLKLKEQSSDENSSVRPCKPLLACSMRISLPSDLHVRLHESSEQLSRDPNAFIIEALTTFLKKLVKQTSKQSSLTSIAEAEVEPTRCDTPVAAHVDELELRDPTRSDEAECGAPITAAEPPVLITTAELNPHPRREQSARPRRVAPPVRSSQVIHGESPFALFADEPKVSQGGTAQHPDSAQADPVY